MAIRLKRRERQIIEWICALFAIACVLPCIDCGRAAPSTGSGWLDDTAGEHIGVEGVGLGPPFDALPEGLVVRPPMKAIPNLIQPDHPHPSAEQVLEHVQDLQQECVLFIQSGEVHSTPLMVDGPGRRKRGPGYVNAMFIRVPNPQMQFDDMPPSGVILLAGRGREWHRTIPENPLFGSMRLDEKSQLSEYALCRRQGLFVNQIVQVALLA